MSFRVRCGCGRDVAVVTGDAGLVVRCGCGREVPVPSLRELRATAPPPPPPAPSRWECPRCGSAYLERLPPNKISPDAGYRCQGCRALLRGRGMLVPYGIVLVLGVGVGVGCVWALLMGKGGDRSVKMLYFAGVGALCAAYAAVQLLRPAVRPWATPNEDDAPTQ